MGDAHCEPGRVAGREHGALVMSWTRVQDVVCQRVGTEPFAPGGGRRHRDVWSHYEVCLGAARALRAVRMEGSLRHQSGSLGRQRPGLEVQG